MIFNRKPITSEEQRRKKERERQALRTGASVADHLAHGRIDKAFKAAVVSGIKLAEDTTDPFKNPIISPLAIAELIRTKFGVGALSWKPETIMSAIDKMFHGWTDEKAALALEKFHDTGEMQTDVPSLVRQKIYAVRSVLTSDSPHTEWHIFEKVGCVFNDRAVNFGIVEKLSTMECAKTIAIMEHLRPDSYSNEIKVYIAACAHEDGFYTLAPSKYLSMSDEHLSRMNYESSGVIQNPALVTEITEKCLTIKNEASVDTDSIVNIQAMKIIAVDTAADDVVK